MISSFIEQESVSCIITILWTKRACAARRNDRQPGHLGVAAQQSGELFETDLAHPPAVHVRGSSGVSSVQEEESSNPTTAIIIGDAESEPGRGLDDAGGEHIVEREYRGRAFRAAEQLDECLRRTLDVAAAHHDARIVDRRCRAPAWR